MPGGSSTTKEEPVKVGSPPPLLGAAGSAVGGTGKDNQIVDPVVRSWLLRQPMPPLLKEDADGRNTVY